MSALLLCGVSGAVFARSGHTAGDSGPHWAASNQGGLPSSLPMRTRL